MHSTPTSPLCLPLPPTPSLFLAACLQARNMQSKSSARQTLRWHFRTHFVMPPQRTPSSHLYSLPLHYCLLHAGRGRSVVSPGVACHLAKAVILLLAKYKSECCANYSQQGHGVAWAWPGIACTAQGGTVDTPFPSASPSLSLICPAAAASSCLISFDCSAKCEIKIQRMLNALTLARDS